jgi:hypothetical protein
MEIGSKVQLKDSNESGEVMSIKENRVSVKMSNGTARVFNADELDEIFKEGGEVKSGFSVESNQYIPYGSSIGKTYYYVVNEKGQTINKKTGKVYKGKQMNNYKFSTENEAKKYAKKLNNKYAQGGDVKSIESKINAIYKKSGFINDDFNWKLKLLEMLQDRSIEAYNIYQSLSAEQKEQVLQEQYEVDNDMGSDGDGTLETTQENIEIMLQGAKKGKKYAKGGNADVENNEMVLNNNKQIKHHTEELPKAVKGKKVPAWVVAKVNRAASDLSDATHYMDGQGETYESGGSLNNNDICIKRIVAGVNKTKKVKDYYIHNRKLIIILNDELGVYDVEILNHHLKESESCSHISDGEFEIGYGEEYKTLILPLKTNDFTIGKFKNGGHVSAGEMNWNKMRQSQKLDFLNNHFTPSITPRTQEILSGKQYRFLPKEVKIEIEKYQSQFGMLYGVEYADGGGVGTHLDLFENYEMMPKNLKKIVDEYSRKYESGNMDYRDTEKFLKEVEAIGYTFDYYLDNEPYGLRPVGVKLNELEGYEDMGEEEYANGGGVEFVSEKKGTLIKGNEIIKYFEKVNGNYRLVFYKLDKAKGKVPKICDAFEYCQELDSNDVTAEQLVELIKKNNLMENGGSIIESSSKSFTYTIGGL